MGIEITRQDLYEKVWSEPLTALAPQFSVSDSALGKACSKANIPRPGPGYWAKIKAGKKVNKVTLPPRFPGASNYIYIGDRYQSRSSLDEDGLPIPIEPIYEETIEQIKGRIKTIVGKVPYLQTKTNTNSLIKKILDQDNEKRQEYEDKGYSWYKPKFDTPIEKRRIRILNAIFISAQSLGCKPDISTSQYDDYHDASILAGNQRVSFNLKSAIRRSKSATNANNKEYLQLIISGDAREKIPGSKWEDTEDLKLEKNLIDIMNSILLTAEIKYRKTLEWHYNWDIKRREEIIEERRLKKIEEDRIAQEHREKQEKGRIDSLLHQATSLQQAKTIREYVRTIKENAENINESADDIEKWVQWALEQADRIDPIINKSFMSYKEI